MCGSTALQGLPFAPRRGRDINLPGRRRSHRIRVADSHRLDRPKHTPAHRRAKNFPPISPREKPSNRSCVSRLNVAGARLCFQSSRITATPSTPRIPPPSRDSRRDHRPHETPDAGRARCTRRRRQTRRARHGVERRISDKTEQSRVVSHDTHLALSANNEVALDGLGGDRGDARGTAEGGAGGDGAHADGGGSDGRHEYRVWCVESRGG